MARSTVIRVPRLPDSVVVETWDQLAKLDDSNTSDFRIHGNIAISLDELQSQENLETSFLLETANFNARGSRVTVQFGRGTSSDNFNSRTPSIHFDEFQITPNSQQLPDAAVVIPFIQAIESVRLKIPVAPQMNETESLNTFVEAQFSQLTALIAKMASQFDDRQAELDRYRKKLENDYQEKEKELSSTHQSDLDKLSQEREKLQKLRSELDDRDNVHVRRELRGKITEDVQQRLQDPDRFARGQQFGAIVALLSLVGSIVLFYFAYVSQLGLSASQPVIETVSEDGLTTTATATSNSLLWFGFAKSILAGLGGTAFLAYTISWFRKLHLDRAESTRSLERYALDIDRASWAIETIIEMSKKDGAEIPKAWVEGVCAGLFSDDTKVDDVTALHALGALMDVAGGAEIGPEGTKIVLNRRGTKAVAKQVS